MVVGHFRTVEIFLVLAQLPSGNGLCESGIRNKACQYLWTFGVEVVAKESGIHAWVGRYLLLVQALYELQGEVGRIAEALVALHLQ